MKVMEKFFEKMNVLLLTSRQDVALAIKQQGIPVAFIVDGDAIFTCTDALNATTMQAIYRKNACNNTDKLRSVFDIGDDYFLRIVHDATVMGPTSGFVNVSRADLECTATAPYGVWTIFKRNMVTMTNEDAQKGYYKAKSFTHTFSKHNENIAKYLNYA